MHWVETVGTGDFDAGAIGWLPGSASGFLLWMSFPPLELSWLAWIALVPLCWLATLAGSLEHVSARRGPGGSASGCSPFRGSGRATAARWLGWLLMALIFSLWWPCFLGLSAGPYSRMRIPLIVAAPIIWVGLEFTRAYFLSGFPWYYLAHSQFRNLYVIQVADITGSLGISLVIVVVNAFVVDLFPGLC